MDNKCRKAKKLMNGYIDELLNEQDKSYFEKHIQICPECKKEYEELKLLISDISETQYQQLPADFSAKLHIRLAQEAQKAEHKTFKLRPYINVAVSAALICMVAFGGNLYERYSNDMQQELITNTKEQLDSVTTKQATPATEVDTTEKASNNTIENKAKIVVQEPATSDNTDDLNVADVSTEQSIEQQQPVAVINEITEAVTEEAVVTDEAESRPASGGGSSAYGKMRTIVFYGEYTVNLASNPEIIDELKLNFNISDDNTLTCNDDEFNRLVEFLNNNNLYIDFVNERTDDNLITFI